MSTLSLLTAALLTFEVPREPASMGAACRPIIASKIETRVNSILSATSPDATSEELSLLDVHWDAHCAQARANANRAVVASLGRLLQHPSTRLAAAEMLIDVGQNLRHVRRAVRAALADERIRDQASLTGARPIVPPSYAVVSTSMRCLLNKIRSGRRNSRLCAYLTAMQN
jgi:hypothetical protein